MKFPTQNWVLSFKTILDSDPTSSESQSENEEEEEEAEQVEVPSTRATRRAKPIDQSTEVEGQDNAGGDGEKKKGNYVLRNVQPIDRYQPIGICLFLFGNSFNL